MKNLIKLILTAVIVFAAALTTAQAVTYDGLDMTFNEETGELYITGSGAVTREALRAAVNGDNAMDDKVEHDIKSVTIEGDITEIGYEAFNECYGLESVVLNHGLKEIGVFAFYRCYNLKSIVFSDTVEKVGEYAFDDNEWLENAQRPIYVGKVLLDYKGADESHVKIAEGTTMIYEGAFEYCDVLETVEIPDSVVEIGDNAFGNCDKLQSVYMPDSVTKIGRGVFEGCNELESVRLSESLTELPLLTFSYCGSLRSLEIPKGIKKIKQAFEGTAWYGNLEETTVINGTVIKLVPDENGLAKVPDGAEHIMGSICEANEDIREVYIPSSIKTIGASAFSGDGRINPTRINKVTFEDAVFDGLVIEEFAFRTCCNLKSIELPKGTKKLGSGAFIFSGLESITLPDGLEIIGDSAFEDCNIEELIIPESVQEIGEELVIENKRDINIYVPSTVKDIDTNAFKKYKYGNVTITVHTPKNSVAYGVAAKCGVEIVETKENRIGEVYGTLIETNVKTTMNGNEINAYSIDGQTIILVRDLENIGFDVSFDEKTRVAEASYNPDKATNITNAVALPDDKVIYTDITVKINDVELAGYNIGGYMAVVAEDMGRYVPDISCTWVQYELTLRMSAFEGMATLDYFINELARVKGYSADSNWEKSRYFADARGPYADVLVERNIIQKREHDGFLYPDSGMTVYLFATYAGRAVYGEAYERLAWEKECYTVPEIDYNNISYYIRSYLTKMYKAGIFATENINGVNTIDVNRVMTKSEVTAALEKLIAQEG